MRKSPRPSSIRFKPRGEVSVAMAPLFWLSLICRVSLVLLSVVYAVLICHYVREGGAVMRKYSNSDDIYINRIRFSRNSFVDFADQYLQNQLQKNFPKIKVKANNNATSLHSVSGVIGPAETAPQEALELPLFYKTQKQKLVKEDQQNHYLEEENLQLNNSFSSPPRMTSQRGDVNNNKSFASTDQPYHTCWVNSTKNSQKFSFLQAPNLILAGTQKSGTTAISTLLSLHPNIVESLRFEQHFFDHEYGGVVEAGTAMGLSGDSLACYVRKEYVNRLNLPRKLPRREEVMNRTTTATSTLVAPADKSLTSRPSLIFEKSPSYFLFPHIPKAITDTCGPWKPKILLILRNPVDRLYSQYKMRVRRDSGRQPTLEQELQGELEKLWRVGLTQAPPILRLVEKNDSDSVSGGFNNRTALSRFPHDPRKFRIPNVSTAERDALDSISSRAFGQHRYYLRYLQRGMYSVQLERWLRYFRLGSDMLVVRYEAFGENPAKVLQQIYSFLGVPAFNLPESVLRTTYHPDAHDGRTSSNRDLKALTPMSNWTKTYLEAFYKPYNDKLAEILGEEWRGVWD